jgi:hypothetical protein
MSMSANITIASNSTTVRNILMESGIILFDENNVGMFNKNTKIIVNGDIIGIHLDPPALYYKLKELKQNGSINIYTGIVWNIQRKEIHINTEGGRCSRPSVHRR